MKKSTSIFTVIVLSLMLFSSCSTLNKTMREPNVKVELSKSDFTLSDQVTAEAKSVKIIGIDWQRLFKSESGTVENGSESINFANIPVIGSVMFDKTSNYALFELMSKNEGYDVVFYPQYEIKVLKPILGIGFLTKITTVKTTARLGKLKK